MGLASGGADREAIAFDTAAGDVPEGKVDVAFRLKRSAYRGRNSLQLDVQDIRPA